MIKIKKTFLASENGIENIEYQENSLHEKLPPVALAHGKNIDAISEVKSAEELAAEKAEQEAKAAEKKAIKAAEKKAIKADKSAEEQE